MEETSGDRVKRALAGLDEREVVHVLRLQEREREYAARMKDWKSDAPGTKQELLARETIERIHRDGYAIIPGFLECDRLDRVRAGLEPMFAGTARISDRLGKAFSGKDATKLQTVHVANLLAKTDAVDDVVTDRLMLSIIRGVLGPYFQLNTCVAMCPDPDTAPQNLHRDEAFFQLYGHREYGYPRMPVVANTLIALDDFTQANGGTLLFPGSQTWGETRKPEMSEVVYNEMKAGSLAIFDGSMFHAGGGNKTRDTRRRSLNINFTRDWLRTQENHFLSISRERILAMPESLQRLLGYRRSGGGLGGCDYQDPLKYLQRLVQRGEGSQSVLGYDAVTDPRDVKSKL